MAAVLNRRWLRAAAVVAAMAAVLLLTACSTSRNIKYDTVALERTEQQVPEAELLDVGIVLFDPGVAEGDADADSLVFPEVRRAEARYMPFHLKTTLEASGQWGPVWVLPEKSDSVDLLVWGRIDQSDGLDVVIRAGAWDATGREWLNKTYRTRVPEKAYSKYRDRTQDPYQNVYNEIANDLLEARRKLSARELQAVHEVAELRYAADLVPSAFEGYLAKGRNGIYSLQRLPAADDPMLVRMRAVREREYAVADTLNEYYASLYYDLTGPYEDWRKVSREETIKYQDLKRSAMLRYLLGGAAILGAVLYEGSGGSNSAVTMVGVMGGIEGIKAGMGKSAEASIAREGLKEQGKSLEAEAEPLVVEVEGQTLRLTGSAEERYKEWRQLLRQIYEKETGLPPPPAAAAPAASG
ncbi:hypothetical protein GPROT2_03307 [Gammaproteobacteria bacterium]|nr:hypothetical protein [Gammaproteobacteria bacterium]QOJ32128.1 MAG: hypothetical protein HRU81_08480 [Gammaproteobacteria bacterium]CAG0945613.1 hypothetical protein GPROT2_03307 [Gammaproteobacteria bacterium]